MQLSWATPLYLLALYGLVAYFIKPKDVIQEEGIKSKKSIKWSPFESITVTLFIFFFGQLIGGLIAYCIPLLLGWGQERSINWLDKDTLGQFVTLLIIQAITMLMIWGFIKRRNATFKTIGLSRRPIWSDFGYAVLGFICYFGLYIAAVAVAKALIPAIDLDQEQQIGFDTVTNLQLPIVFISLVVLPPIVEEIMTRGLLYTGLKNRMPAVAAVTITSGLFAIAHLQAGSGAPLLWVAAIDTFVLSTVLIYLRDKTGSLWSSIAVHALKNFIAFLSLFVFHVVK